MKYYVAAWMEGEFGREGIHVYVWLCPFTVHLKNITTLFVNWLYPIQNTVRRSDQSILKQINPEYSPEELMLKLKLPILWPPDVKH